MKRYWVNTGLILLSLQIGSLAWADTTAACKNCSSTTKQGQESPSTTRFKFNPTPSTPTKDPHLAPTKPHSPPAAGSIFGDGSSISKDFKVTERASDGRSVTTSNGDFNFTISNDLPNPNKRARHQGVFESGSYRNGKPPSMPRGTTVEDLMKGKRR